jgi:hypothetical protein
LRLTERPQEWDCHALSRPRCTPTWRDLLNVLDTVKQAGAGFRPLKDTWADTTTHHGQI